MEGYTLVGTQDWASKTFHPNRADTQVCPYRKIETTGKIYDRRTRT
jgi:hypothetical protein